jgi:NADH-quinone oxidoreductase subunit C/D
MMTDHNLTIDQQWLIQRFPQGVIEDTRSGYQGYVVLPDMLLQFSKVLRDELAFDYLTSVTGVDYLAENKLEVVYHVYKTTGGPALVYKTQIDRDNGVVPSLVSIFPGAELQEREIWDLFGVRFEDHPDLRRILLWEGFAGHPLRKDWHEPFFEDSIKPFKTRWPDGHIYRVEDNGPLKDNVDFPGKFNPEEFEPEADSSLYDALRKVDMGDDIGFQTDQIVINLGPQHPSTHGVFRMAALLQGETVINLKPVMGYLHRNHEKIGERNTYLQNMPYTDRLDYITSMSNNFGYAIAVEKLLGIQPPERADYIRVIMAELTRICSHMLAIGFLLNDLGAFYTPVMYALTERELILDVFEEVSGSRMMCNYYRFGGVARDGGEEQETGDSLTRA